MTKLNLRQYLTRRGRQLSRAGHSRAAGPREPGDPACDRCFAV
jgi:hypothetical protein